jgi:hypothetical protein
MIFYVSFQHKHELRTVKIRGKQATLDWLFENRVPALIYNSKMKHVGTARIVGDVYYWGIGDAESSIGLRH